MLLRLLLRDFVIVDAAEIEFGSGFTVLSGETGAGKSILLDALGLAIGARADAGMVREGRARADITAEFAIDPDLDEWLAERDLRGDPGRLLARRVVEADGRSRALINGHPATIAQLRELGERLIDIHGQHAAQSMLRGEGQRGLLDGFAGLDEQVRDARRLHGEWRDCVVALESAERDDRELALERERVQWQHEELSRLRVAPGEWESLNTEHRRLSNAASLIEGARLAADTLGDRDDAVSARLRQVLHRLRPLVSADPRIAEPVQLLESASIQVDEAASGLAAYAEDIELDPARLAEVDQRIGALFGAARKFRLAPESLAAAAGELAARLAELDAAQDVERLRTVTDLARAAYDKVAKSLTTARREAARRLETGVSANIQRLGMSGGRLAVAIEPVEPSPSGVDRVEFRIAAHAGGTPRPLAKVASGGELSRIGLAIAVLAAQANPVPVLIFDEADAGVGGAVAEVIGRLMRSLGDSRQVFCVTHLPQVAAHAHHHFSVSKATVDGQVVSRVARLERAARVDEIARMLGGVEITATTRKHARELLADA